MKRLILILCFLIAGCAAGGMNFSKLEAGMSKDKVIAIMGKPDGLRVVDDREVLIYADRFVNPWEGWNKGDYLVALKDNKVVEYQVFNIRDDNAAQRQAGFNAMGLMGAQMMDNANRQPVQPMRQPITCRTYASGITTCQ